MFFKINEIDKSLTKLTERERKPKSMKIRDEKEDITTGISEIQRIIMIYFHIFLHQSGKLKINR